MSNWGLIYWDENTHRWIWRTYKGHIQLKEGPLDTAQNRKLPEPTLCKAFQQKVSNRITTRDIVVVDF
jgi:hypothetical protein